MNEHTEEPADRNAPPADPFGNVVYSYSRAQAIADGVLVDVSTTARQAGFKWPFAMTTEVWGLIEQIPEKHRHEDIQGRLWDVLMMARHAIRNAKPGEEEIFYEVILHQENANRLRLRLECGPGDDLNPVLTLMLPEQD